MKTPDAYPTEAGNGGYLLDATMHSDLVPLMVVESHL